MEFAKSLLDQYFATKKTKSATAHSNAHGITVTVRFSHEDLIKDGDCTIGVSDSEAPDTQSFKRISQKQFKRNRQRYGHFKSKQNSDNDSDKVHNTRSKSKLNSVEDIRHCDDSSDNSEPPFISPEPVKQHYVSGADCGSASAKHFHSTESPCSLDYTASSFDVHISPGVTLHEESTSEIAMPSPQSECLHSMRDDSDSTSDTCDDKSSIHSGSCYENDCSYGGGLGVPYNPHPRMCTFRICNRCPPGMWVCAKCRANGKHKRHKHYLIPPDKPKFIKECLDGTCPACNGGQSALS